MLSIYFVCDFVLYYYQKCLELLFLSVSVLFFVKLQRVWFNGLRLVETRCPFRPILSDFKTGILFCISVKQNIF